MDARDEVIRAAEARASALAHGDALALEALLHEEFRWTSHTGETFGRDEYVRRNTTGAAWRSQELSGVEVTVVGDVAVLLAEVTDVVRRGDDEQAFRMPMTQVWVRDGDRWRCLGGHAGPLRA